jgi:enoyl-CoA hydratase
MRVASENARFGQPEVNLGLIPGYAGTQRIFQLIGKGKGLELLLTGDPIKAEEALVLGLVNHVVKQEDLRAKCLEIAEKIKSKSPYAISKVIECANAHYQSAQPGFQKEITEFGQSFSTSDFKEGTTAFIEKRRASF